MLYFELTPELDVASDILSWIPTEISSHALDTMDVDGLRRLLFDPQVKLRYDVSLGPAFRCGDLHMAGPPCVDYSPMGQLRREAGRSRILFVLWARGIRDHLPGVVVFENFHQFPVAVLRDLLGDLYTIHQGLVVFSGYIAS